MLKRFPISILPIFEFVKHIFYIALLLLITNYANGQDQLLQLAKEYYRNGDFGKAADTYKQLWEYQSGNEQVFEGYFNSLLESGKDKEAEKIVEKQIKSSGKKDYYIHLARVYQRQSKDKKARKALDAFTENAEMNPRGIQALAKEMEQYGFLKETIYFYESLQKKSPEQPYLFAQELAILYDKTGEHEKATERLLDLYISRPEHRESIQSSFQILYDNDQKREELEARILKRSRKEPENVGYHDLLIWLYTQRGEYDKALKQVCEIDQKAQEDGRRVLGFARVCFREKKYPVAITAYDYVIRKGARSPYETLAESERLGTIREQMIENGHRQPGDIEAVLKAYETFFEKNPRFRREAPARDYAGVLALYAQDIPKAIDVLKEVVDFPRAEKDLRARCKLDMGDYELLRGNIWESSLLYSQVDKEFKQDILGEEAQFRNAKLSFYNGEFKWAQAQLDILKASTSELISNDAIDLSVLITENNPVKDSDDTPLRMFSRADLLLYQNRLEEAENTLDSIENHYPGHPLIDNILMERATIEYKKNAFNRSALYLQKIVDEHGKDVLADDALFQLAEIYETRFNNPEEAKRLYEKLVLEYSGSTFAPRARQNFRRLRGDAL